MHGHGPLAGDTLLRAIAEIGLVSGFGEGPPIGSSFMGKHGSFGRNPGPMFHHDDMIGIGRIVLGP